jgi:HamA
MSDNALHPELPDPFLVSLFPPSEELEPIALCAGYDNGEWRCDELARHLTEWLIDFALRPNERAIIPAGKLVATVRTAASRVFKTDGMSRGEAGELLLHVACRQEFGTTQIVARLYYKSSLDQQIHGFDSVHFREISSGTIELWLGESKFYSTVTQAIADARKSIRLHIERNFLKAQKTLILPKITDENAALAEKLKNLFHTNTPLDDFISALVVPVLIACDSDTVNSHSNVTDSYRQGVHVEMSDIAKRIKSGTPFSSLRIQPIYVPLASKEDLRKAFGTAVKGLQ